MLSPLDLLFSQCSILGQWPGIWDVTCPVDDTEGDRGRRRDANANVDGISSTSSTSSRGPGTATSRESHPAEEGPRPATSERDLLSVRRH